MNDRNESQGCHQDDINNLNYVNENNSNDPNIMGGNFVILFPPLKGMWCSTSQVQCCNAFN